MRKLSMEELGRTTLTAFREMPKTPLVLVLEDVRSALNVGSAFRTADAFALKKIYLCGITATPPHREILKTALGATETVEWEFCQVAEELVAQLRTEGYTVFAVEQAEGSLSLESVNTPSEVRIALVFGNEVSGVSQGVMNLADGCVEVPQIGTKHSLNIAVCLGIVVWEFFKKMRFGH